jgi:hypothetical protein
MRLISQPEKLRAQTLVTDTTSCHCLFSWNSSIEWEPLEIVLRARSCRGRLSAAKDSPVWSHSDRAIMNARKRTPLPIPVAISPSKQGRSGRMGEKERAWGMGREREREIRHRIDRSRTSRGPQCVERRHGTAVRPISRARCCFCAWTDFPRRKVGLSEDEESPVTWKTTHPYTTLPDTFINNWLEGHLRCFDLLLLLSLDFGPVQLKFRNLDLFC